jgi:E3 ubiquitin-protein ligase RNF1/2
MPAQKRSASPPADREEDADSEDSLSYSSDNDEYVVVKLSDIRKEVQCPICLGIIRKTRTVMECLHRFCRECIDKSMRLGNNECPQCRTHCASRRSLRDDPNYDALIAAIYPDIDKYEEEEFSLHDEDKWHNKQIQTNIAQTYRRQSEALTRRRTTAKVTAAAIVRKAHGKFRNGQNGGKSGRKRQKRSMSADVDEHTALKHSSSDDEESQEIRQSQSEKRIPSSLPETSANTDNSNDDCDEINHGQVEVSRESTGASHGIRGNTEILVWGKGGARTNMRYGSVSGSNSKNARGMRVAKMVNYLLSKAREEDENEFDIQFTLLPSENDENLPSLETPYLCCSPTVSVNHLCKLLALQLSLPAEDLEIVVEKQRNLIEPGSQSNFSHLGKPGKGKPTLGASENQRVIEVLQQEATLAEVLEQEATLAEIFSYYTGCRGNLALTYRRKL